MIPSLCRGARVAKKSPKKVSACAAKKKKQCRKSPSCSWAKAYDRKDGKHVAAVCRRRKRRSGAKSARRRSPSPNMAAYRGARSM